MKSEIPGFLYTYPAITAFFERADHVDVKTVTGEVSLRQFVAGMFAYQPAWVTFLFGVRMLFVKFLGIKQKGVPRSRRMQAEDVPMEPGKAASFFKVKIAQEEAFWVGEVDDTHLRALLGVVVEPLGGREKRFYVITVVYYHKWSGPVYFNVIRPFHHLVVKSMARQGAQMDPALV